ncbi:MAG TPA: hypothetical protein VIS52_09610 [Motiliproteus sp.]
MKIASLLFTLLALGGCQTLKPASPPQALQPPSAAVTAAETSARVEQQLQAQQQRVESVENRLTLVQEQLIKSNQTLVQLQQRAQQQLVATQQLQMLLAAKQAEAPAQPSSDDGGLLEQLVLLVERLEQLSASNSAASAARPGNGVVPEPSGPGYHLASTYTDKGVWVIFKYDQTTGLSWRAETGGWAEVAESNPLPPSRYQVVLHPASGDVKGYVAARIDYYSGVTWWLNGDRWELLQ